MISNKTIELIFFSLFKDGSLAGDVGFDPLGFGNDKDGQPAGEQVRYMREAELKHGRLAMLAGLGWPTSELYHKQLAEILNLDSILTPEGRAPSVMNGGLLNGWIEVKTNSIRV